MSAQKGRTAAEWQEWAAGADPVEIEAVRTLWRVLGPVELVDPPVMGATAWARCAGCALQRPVTTLAAGDGYCPTCAERRGHYLEEARP